MSEEIAGKIRAGLRAVGQKGLKDEAADRLAIYVSLILRWNARVNLTAVRDEEGIVSRHIIESIIVSRNLPETVRALLDFGSGAGLPGIPIAICRPEIEVTLAESQNKKAAFLAEAVRVLGLRAKVHAGRAEELRPGFDCVTLRAVDRMAAAVRAGAALVSAGGWLALMTTEGDLPKLKAAAGKSFNWMEPESLAGSEKRILALGQAPPA